jgi:transcriptional regulator with XRE-family HTH domain
MSEAAVAVRNDTPSADLPLSVLLFSAAMSQKIALSKFAEQLGINPLSLRQFISGQTQRPRSRTLEVLARALGMSVDEVRHRSSLRPTTAPQFADWLKARMNGTFSRARLTRETGISDGALRNYLSGQTLPDADQAQRLAETLDIDPLELAKVLVADQTVRSGGETVSPAPSEREGDPGFGSGIYDMTMHPLPGTDNLSDDVAAGQRTVGGVRIPSGAMSNEEEHLLALWHQLHPQGRRATLIYIAGLLAEG